MSLRVRRFERTDIWREGKWFDLWSIVHFLSGISIGFAFHFIQFGGLATVVVVFLLLIAYEMWEVIVHIEETPTNRILDVVVGMTSFVLTFFILNPRLSPSQLLLTFGIVFTLNIIMSIIGWHASHKAATLEKNMHTRYDRQRTKIIARRARLRQKLHRSKN